MAEMFNRATWKSRAAAWWRDAAGDVEGTMRRLGVHTAYGLLAASAWLPLLAAYADDPGPAVAALAGVLSGVGTNLLSNLVQGAYDEATAPQKAEQELAERPDLRAEYERILAALDLLAAAQTALGKQWAAFEAQLGQELARMGGTVHVESGGGAVVFGDVVVEHGDFVGRDKYESHHYAASPPPDVTPLREAYLRHLAAECSRLPLGAVDPRFLQAGPETPLPLPEVYVDLDVVAPVRQEREKGEAAFTGRLGRGEGGERTPLLEAIAHPQATRFVLLGDPGSGKTTFANYLAYALATGVPPGMLLQGLLPVRLVLREVAARCIPAEATKGEACMVWNALRADVAARLGEEAAGVLFPYLQRRLLEEGGLLLLDGLDEVPEADRQRKCLLEAVGDLAAALPRARSRVVVTARPYAYADPRWHLSGFATLTLAPFSREQVERFVARWYQAVRPAMGWDEATARERGERLLEALAEQPYLADLATRPLLLTLMATLHTSWGRLPQDRADLYEETVRLLLSRWQRAREVKRPDGQSVVEPGIARVLAVDESHIRAALHRLACQVHEQQGAGKERTEGPADVGEGAVLAAFGPLLPDDLHPRVLLDYLETRAGLLVGRAPGVYAFPHRSFQEYLAACHLADGPDFADQLRARVWADPAWWREVFLLGVGKAKQGGLGNAVHVVNVLVPEGPEETSERDDICWRSAVLGGQALVDLRFPEAAEGKRDFEAVLKRVRRWLVALLETPGALAPRERAEAGDLLGKLGDSRPGVGILPLPPRERAGVRVLPSPSQGEGLGVRVFLPDILWVEVPAGPFLMGSTQGDKMAYEDERPRHSLDMPAFIVSRYPVTSAQYRPFVESGGYDQPCYWTPEGWAWRTGEREPDLSPIDDEDLRKSYTDWLAGRPLEKRGQPFWWDHPRWGLPNRPVVGVTWYEALAYCRWLTEQVQMANGESRIGNCGWQVWHDGQVGTWSIETQDIAVRLPSEAEWEKTARGADGRRWPWGNEWAEGKANTEESGIGETSAVGAFPAGASPCGALDVAGNVWEWTSSLYRPYPYRSDDGREDPRAEGRRVVRGGAWDYFQRYARCAYRYRNIPDYFYYYVGLRVVVSLALPPAEF